MEIHILRMTLHLNRWVMYNLWSPGANQTLALCHSNFSVVGFGDGNDNTSGVIYNDRNLRTIIIDNGSVLVTNIFSTFWAI